MAGIAAALASHAIEPGQAPGSSPVA